MKAVWQAAIVLSAFALALVGSSCASSEMIDNAQGQVTIQMSTSATAAGFPWARMIVNQMKFHPTSGGALRDPLALLSFATSIDMNNASSLQATPVRVTAQTYALDSFQASFELNVVPSGPGVTSCNGGVVEALRTTLGQESTIVPACQFTVPASGIVSIRVSVDAEGLATLLTSKFSCSSGIYTPPTSAEILPFLTFQCEP